MLVTATIQAAQFCFFRHPFLKRDSPNGGLTASNQTRVRTAFWSTLTGFGLEFGYEITLEANLDGKNT